MKKILLSFCIQHIGYKNLNKKHFYGQALVLRRRCMSQLFFVKVRRFFKKNAYSIVVGACAFLALVAVVVAAVFSAGVDNSVLGDTPVQQVSANESVLFTMPIKNATISKEFADKKLLHDKTTGYWQTHNGIDILANVGTDVYAAYGGEVLSVETTMMEGTIITIKHSNNLETIYKGLSEDDVLVSKGDKVDKGEKIGKVGTMLKEKEDDSHLHFEIKENGKNIDPAIYMESSDK